MEFTAKSHPTLDLPVEHFFFRFESVGNVPVTLITTNLFYLCYEFMSLVPGLFMKNDNKHTAGFYNPENVFTFLRISFSFHCDDDCSLHSTGPETNDYLWTFCEQNMQKTPHPRNLTSCDPKSSSKYEDSLFCFAFWMGVRAASGWKGNLFHSELICEDFVSCREILRKINGSKQLRFLLTQPPFPEFMVSLEIPNPIPFPTL